MENIWKKLKKPFFVLAPMEDVTDTIFRQIVADCAPPEVFFTEFTSVDGLFSKGRKAVARRLEFTTKEKPLIVQIWGKNPENYFKAGKILSEMGFDGIDINMGCPVKKVIQNGGCSALIKNQSLASEIIKATQEGAKGLLPVSVKTRIGFDRYQTEQWIPFLLQHKLDALTVHGRTTKEESNVPNNWEEIGKSVEFRDQIAPETIILGNGDVMNKKQGKELAYKYALDGIMIGRGIFQNPFIFDENIDFANMQVSAKLELLLKHTRLYIEKWGEDKHFQVMKKFFKIYVNGFEGAVELRSRLMPEQSFEKIEEIVKDAILHYNSSI